MTPPTNPSYTAQALRTESPITPALQTRLKDNARLVHAVLGLQTEAGELADPVKKHIYYGRPLDLVNLREEIGDCLWYLAIAADALGTTLEAEQARNLAKLRARYPHVFTAEAAQVRDLDREREVLEEDVADNPHTLRQQLAAARAESVAMRKQLDEAFKLIADVNTAGLQLWDKLQIANKAAAELIVERHAARAEIESLRKELANAQRELSEEMQDAVPPTWAPLVSDLRRRLRESQQELGRELLDAEARGHKLERLQAFVAEVRQARDDYQWPDSWDAILNALAELDAEPAPVAEPARCPECERLQAELETANEHRTDLLLFVDKVRKSFRVWGGDESFFHSVSHALYELDTNSSATLASSVVKESLTPAPVAEPLDAEGGA